LTERSSRSSVRETIYQRRLQLSSWRHTRPDRGELGILQRATVLPLSTCTKGPRMQTIVAAVMTCFIANTTTESSVMDFRANRHPDRLYGDGCSWSVSFIDTNDEVNRSLAHTGRGFPHWCMTYRAHPVSDIMLPESRHPQCGLSLFNNCSHSRMSCEGTRRTVWRRS